MMVHAYFEERGRKFLWLLYLMIICCVSANGQNLVPNGDFETYSPIPNNLEQIPYATGWSAVNPAPTTTPDYFNINGTYPASIPTNTFGMQNVYLTNTTGYAGIGIKSIPTSGLYINYWEYITTTLPVGTSLYPGYMYNISFDISRAGNSNIGGEISGAMMTIGALLSDGLPTQNSSEPIIPTSKQFLKIYTDNGGGTKLEDTTVWQTIQFSNVIIPPGPYLNRITIGNFDTPGNFRGNLRPLFGTNYYGAYYYIDNVQITAYPVPECDCSYIETTLKQDADGCYTLSVSIPPQCFSLITAVRMNPGGTSGVSPIDGNTLTNGIVEWPIGLANSTGVYNFRFCTDGVTGGIPKVTFKTASGADLTTGSQICEKILPKLCGCEDYSVTLEKMPYTGRNCCSYKLKIIGNDAACSLFGWKLLINGEEIGYKLFTGWPQTGLLKEQIICVPSNLTGYPLTVQLWTGESVVAEEINGNAPPPTCTKEVSIPSCAVGDCDCDDFALSVNLGAGLSTPNGTCFPVTISKAPGSTCSVYKIDVYDMVAQTSLPSITNGNDPISFPSTHLLCGTCSNGIFSFLHLKLTFRDQNGNIICPDKEIVIRCDGTPTGPEVCDCDDFDISYNLGMGMETPNETCFPMTISKVLGSTCSVYSIEIYDLENTNRPPISITNYNNPIALPTTLQLCGSCSDGIFSYMRFRLVFKKQDGTVICDKEIIIPCNGGGPIGSRIGAQNQSNSNEKDPNIFPEDISLSVNPNPSDNEINISFELVQNSDVKIELYNAAGNFAAVLKKGNMPKGTQLIRHSIKEYPSGSYHIRVFIDGNTYSIPVIISH